MNEQGFGVLVGILVGLIIAAILIKMMNKNGKFKSDYDERQEAIRGRGFKWAAYTAWILVGAGIVFEIGDVNLHMDNAIFLLIILIISLLVQTSHAIWNDAYFGGNNNIRRYAAVAVVVTIINAVTTIMYVKEHELIVDGVLTWKAMNGMLAIMFFIIGIEFIIKSMVKKDDLDSEEE